MKISFIKSAILILCLCSCASGITKKNDPDENLLIPESYDLQPKTSLSRAEIAEDLNTLLYALKNGYGGRKYVPQDTFRQTLTDIEQLTLENASSQTLCEKLATQLMQIPDMHLSAKLNGNRCNKARVSLSKAGRVGENFARNKNKAWELNSVKVGRNRVPVLSVLSFPNRQDAGWNNFLDTVYNLRITAPAIIIDLRGNGGGDDTMGLNMVDYMFGQNAPTAVLEIVKSQTPATFAITANRYLKLKAKKEVVPPYFVQRLEQELINYKEAKEGKLEAETVIPGDGGPPFDPAKGYKKPIAVLTDKGCASSCESVVEALQLHPHAVTIGEATAGYIHFGNTGSIVLPNSQIEVQIATDFWKFKDGRFLEGIGYEPKIRVPADKDALDAAKTYLKTKIPR